MNTDFEQKQTKETMKEDPNLRPEILTGTFVVVGYGEVYNARVVKGSELFDYCCELLYGKKEDAPEEELVNDVRDLNDGDQWSHYQDFQFCHWARNIGEIDHLEIWRVTDK